jgi:glycosyltransferase involved in cell wall biosynthesis
MLIVICQLIESTVEGVNLTPIVSIIIPAYNEERHIANTILETNKTLNSFLPADFEIIVIDDGSIDDTFNKATEMAQTLPNIRVFRLPKNSGKGVALLHGFKVAKGDILVYIDADLEFHPKNIETYLKYMETFNADVVISSKRHPLSKLRYPVFRRIASYYYNMFIRILFGLDIHDTQAGFKLIKSEIFETFCKRLCVKRFAFDLEFLVVARQYGFKIIEAPINLEFKRFNNRIGIGTIFKIFQDTCAVFYRLYVKNHYIDIPKYGLGSLLKSFFPQNAKRLRYEAFRLFNPVSMPLKTVLHVTKPEEAHYEKKIPELPSVSVIIPTENISDVLQDCLESLQNLGYPEDLLEIIVVKDFDGYPKNTIDEYFSYHSAFKYPISILNMNGTPAGKRNYGVSVAKGSIIAFTDSDCIVPSQWISKAVKHFIGHSVAFVGGPNLNPPKSNWRQECGGDILSSWLGTGPMRARYTPIGETRTTTGSELILCNMFVRKSIFEKFQGFNEQLFPNEENEFLHRIVSRSGTNNPNVMYDPTLFVYHHRRSIILPHCKQIFKYGVGRGKMTRMHPKTAVSLSPAVSAFAILATLFPVLLIYHMATLKWNILPVIPFGLQIFYSLSVLFGLYFFGTFAYGVKWTIQHKCIKSLLAPITLFLTHLTYGYGMMKGLLSKGIKRELHIIQHDKVPMKYQHTDLVNQTDQSIISEDEKIGLLEK